MSSIPILSLAEREGPAFCRDLRSAFSEFGFVAFRDHGLRPGLRRHVLTEVEAFFSSTDERKMSCHLRGTGGARGFTPFGIEVAKDQTTPDLKEFYHIGREFVRAAEVAPAAPEQEAALALLPQNVWPDWLPSFRPALLELYRELDEIGGHVLQAVATGLELEASYFEKVVDVGNSLLRALHYPAVPKNPKGAVRAAAHEDINLITLLVGSEQPGLQVLSRSGGWVAAPGGDELIICNVGDMLQRLTNDVLVSTTHRVVNPPSPWSEQSRYSLPFFLHPNSDFLIRSLSTCVTENHPERYPQPILANDFLQQRLREIGLI